MNVFFSRANGLLNGTFKSKASHRLFESRQEFSRNWPRFKTCGGRLNVLNRSINLGTTNLLDSLAIDASDYSSR